MEVPKHVEIVMLGTTVQEVVDRSVEQEIIARVQSEHNVNQGTHVQEALDQIVEVQLIFF